MDGSVAQIDGEVRLAEETSYNWDVPSLGWDLLELFEMRSFGREWMSLDPL